VKGLQADSSQERPPHIGQTGSARTIVTPYPQPEQWNSPLTLLPVGQNSTKSSVGVLDAPVSCIPYPLEYLLAGVIS
jgi:hypothetical protein